MNLISRSVKDTLNLGKRIAKNLKKGDIVCLFGEFGSGKTMLTKGIALGLGVGQNIINSPSFVIMRQYPQARIPLHHFDLYRLKLAKDILALGYEEFFYQDAVTVIEWAGRLRHLLPQKYLKITLKIKGKKKREIEIEDIGH